MNITQRIYQTLVQNNLLAGIFISCSFSSIFFIINPIVFIIPGDLDLVFGVSFGLFFALKFRKDAQNPLQLGLLVGLVGATTSGLAFTFISYGMLLGAGTNPNPGIIWNFLGLFLLISIIIGLILGLLGGYISKNRIEHFQSDLYSSEK